MNQIRRFCDGRMRPFGGWGRSVGKRLFGALILASGALVAGNVAAQSANFQTSFYPGFVGTPIPITLETRDGNSILIGGGSLTWDISDCTTNPVFQPSPPPAAPDASGITTANLLFSAPDACDVGVQWDPDGPGGATALPFSLTIVDAAPAPLVATPQTPLAQFLTPLSARPVFSVLVTDGGVPQPGMFVSWNISLPNKSSFFFGTVCSATAFSTDANGIATLDFGPGGVNIPLTELGSWIIDMAVFRPGEGPCDQSRSSPAKGSIPSTNFVSFGLAVEDVSIAFQNPPTSLQAGTTANPFTVLLQGAMSGSPVVGATVNFTAGPSGTLDPSAGAEVTDSSGLATYFVDAGVPDLMGGFVNAQTTVPLASPVVRSANAVVAVVDLDLAVSTPAPATPTFTDEQAAGFSVIAAVDSGNGFDPAGNVPVTFSILSGPATFFGGGSSVIVNTDSMSGIAASPALQIGRGNGPVVVQADGGPYGSLTQNYVVQASTYSLDASNTPATQDIQTFEFANLAVLLQRSGSSTPVPLPSEPINWQISPNDGSSISPSPASTDTSGVSSVSFFPAGEGSYTISATFNTGFTTNPTQSFTVNVTAPVFTLDAVSGDGQIGEPGSTLPNPLVVLALDDGLPPATAFIEWTATGGVQLFSSSNSTPSSLLTELADSSGNSSVQVVLPAQPGTFTVTATRVSGSVRGELAKGSQGPPGPSVSFTVSSMEASTASLDPVEGNGQQGLVGQPGAPLGALLQIDGQPAPAGSTVNWSVLQGDVVLASSRSQTDASGVARLNFNFGSTPGESTIRAVSIRGTQALFQVFAAEGGRLSIVSGNEQTAPPNAMLPEDFVVEARSPNGGVLDGAEVLWSVDSGGGSLSVQRSATNSAGRASTRLTLGPSGGQQQVTARLATGAEVTFTANAAGVSRGLSIFRGNMQRSLVFTSPDLPLEVQFADSNAAPIVGSTILWELLSGDAQLSASSATTDSDGRARITLTFGATPGMVQVSARAPGVPEPVLFTLTSVLPAAGNLGGDGQSGPINSPLPQPISVDLNLPAAKALIGVPVQWQILTGGGSLGNATTTSDAEGRASNTWTLGPQVGEQTVQATLPGGQTVIFRATATAAGVVGTLRVVSGTPQSIATNAASAPLVVEVVNASGQAIPNVLVEWSADAQRVSLRDASNRTGSDGRASNIATLLLPGAATVTAQVANSDIPAVSFQLTGGVAQIPGLDPRQRDVGTAIDNACPALAAIPNRTPEQEDLFRRCSEFVGNAGDNPGEVRNALNELPTDIGPTMAGQSTQSVNTQFDNLDVRLHMIRGEKSGGQRNQFNIGLWTPDGTLPLSFLPSAFLAAGAAEDEEVGLDFDRWGFFATGQIGRGEVDAGERAPEFDYDIAGLTFGVDYRFSDRLVGGIALGYSDNDAELADDRGDVATKGWNLSAYATWYSEQSWYVDGTLMVGQLDYDLRRRLSYSITALDGGRTTVNQVASASPDGDVFGTSVSLGRDWQKGPWSLNGYVRGQYSRVKTDGFVESMLAGQPGQGLALAVDSRTTESMTSVFGGRATYILSRDWGILMPNFSVEWEHEFEDDPGRLTARLAFDPTASRIERFSDDIDTDYFNVGVGVSALFPGGRSAYLYYEELVGASRQSQGLLSLGLRFEF